MSNIFVLLTIVSRFMVFLWLCCLGPPLASCVVKRRERAVVVCPMYVLSSSSQSPSWQSKKVYEVGFLRAWV